MEQSPPPTHYEEIVFRTDDQLSLGQVKQQVLGWLATLDGWCSIEKASFLVDLVYKTKPQVIVEIGVWGGKSLIPMAHTLKALQRGGIIHGIDPWDSNESVQGIVEEVNRAFWSWANHDWVLQRLLENIERLHLQGQIRLIKSTSAAAPPIEQIDLLHIDGNHSDATSYLDVTKWVPLVKSGGWIIFDDMGWSEHGVLTNVRAIEWLDAHCMKFAEFNDTCTWGVWVKP